MTLRLKHSISPETAFAIIDVAEERNHQLTHSLPEHDNGHTPSEWCSFLRAYTSWAWMQSSLGKHDQYRKRLVQVAALAIAAIESYDRNIVKRSTLR